MEPTNRKGFRRPCYGFISLLTGNRRAKRATRALIELLLVEPSSFGAALRPPPPLAQKEGTMIV